MLNSSSCFTPFKSDTSSLKKPTKFTFPFYYKPDELSKLACAELQEYLTGSHKWIHNFGLSRNDSKPIGKMFGVLVVENENKKIGYITAFSGKLAGVNTLDNFVPPIYDMLDKDGFFMKGQLEITLINKRVRDLEGDPKTKEIEETLEKNKTQFSIEIEALKTLNIELKKERKQKRTKAKLMLNKLEYTKVNEALNRESIIQKNKVKYLTLEWNATIENLRAIEKEITSEYRLLKEKRKVLSVSLQAKLFDEYHFLNANGTQRSLLSIFRETPQKLPPAAAGECAAPKLLQYAYLNKLKPISMAEFWWGAEPNSTIRKHKHYYPSCQGKCHPILSHMLLGLEVDDNPLLINNAEKKELEIVFEDDYLAIVNKPTELLSVPGKTIKDSVYHRIKIKYPSATGPIIVHRLDMATSGIMLIAKTKHAHDHLQQQFIKRTIKKRYTALLDGIIEKSTGIIDLPIRVDFDDRPRQLVCYEHGKTAQTKFKVIAKEEGRTRIHLFPITGRTHQLRMHASHPSGLNTAIVGDDLYGRKNTRLHLHAAYIAFKHPKTNQEINFTVTEDF